MKQITILHKSGKTMLDYTFTLYEQAKVVIVDKGDELAEYRLTSNGKGWRCDCWSGSVRKYCWHRLEALPRLRNQSSLSGFEAELAEDAMVIRIESEAKKDGGF